jgi:hypothetical protein
MSEPADANGDEKSSDKKLENPLYLLLSPSAKIIGKALEEVSLVTVEKTKQGLSFFKEKIDDWREARRQQILQKHIDSAKAAPQSNASEQPSITQMQLFEDWAAEAQNHDPDESEVGQFWQGLLRRIIADGSPPHG